ncbi:MAG: SLOG family protein [Oscillospiraceae bacterium]
MTQKSETCCFTGHRMEKLPWGSDESDPNCRLLCKQISDAVEAVFASGVRHFICGMATGCDMYFCEAVIALRAEHEELTLEAAIPWEGQSKGWSKELKTRYHRLVEECDFYTLVQEQYSSDCLMRRNRYMVDNSSVIIAAYSGRPGGTMSTLLYAMRQGLEIIELAIE